MKKIMSMLLCILLFVTYFIFLVQINFNSAFSKKSIDKVIENMEFMEQISTTESNNGNQDWNISLNEIYEVAEDYDISKSVIDNILNSESAKSFILEYLENNTNYIINNDSSVKLDIDDIQNNIEEAVNNYIENEDNNLTESEKKKITQFTSDNSYKIANKLPTPELIEIEMSPTLTKFVQSFFNNTTRIILIGILVIFIILIILLQRNKSMLYLGVTVLITNIVTLLFSPIINTIVNHSINYESSILLNIIKNFSRQIINSYLIISIIGIVLAIILLITYKNVKKTTK